MNARKSTKNALLRALLLCITACLALWAPTSSEASHGPVLPVALQALAAPPDGVVHLPGSLHPRARPELDVGRMNPATRLSGMSLLFRMSLPQGAVQKDLLFALQDPASPRYHRWLSPEQYAAQLGAGPMDVARAAAWLRSHGLSVDGASRTATRLAFSGTVAQIERAFWTEMHLYHVDGATHFAMSQAPSVPEELARVILGVHGAHDFRAHAPSHRARPQYALPITEPDGGPGRYPVLAPADFATIYDVESLYAAGITGAGQRIAIAGQSDFNDADIAAFRSTFGLSANAPGRTLVPSSGAARVDPDDLDEAELDLEWAGAIAREASIDFVFTGDGPNSDALDALNYAIEQRLAPVLSTSYGGCESWMTPSDASFEETYGAMAALEGMTVLADAGDTGAAGCDSQTDDVARRGAVVQFPASVPGFVAVGGSQLQITASNQSMYLDSQLDALSYIPESAWNETLEDIDGGYGGLGAGGGGRSKLFAKPYWQGPTTPNDGARDLPDVVFSASADTLPYAVALSWTAADGDAQAPQAEALTAYGGTSASTPAFAGIFALLNQAISEANPGATAGLGNANPLLYALAGSASGSEAFHDITSGNNVVPCAPGSPDCPSAPPYQFGYAAGPGYDQATGLGSIDAAQLVASWTALAPTSTTLQVQEMGSEEGSPVQLAATIQSMATSSAMTGSVTFYFVGRGEGGAAISGVLGEAAVTPSTSGAPGGRASLTAAAPGGLAGSGAKIGAFYGGDVHHLASASALSSVAGASSLSLCPVAITLAVGQTGFAFTTTGGSPPIQWGTHSDRTCSSVSGEIACSTIDAGVFTAGPRAGSVTVVAVDQYDSYVTAEVTVTDAGADGALPPLPVVSCAFDAGAIDAGASEASSDAGMEVLSDAAIDAPATDAPAPDGSTPSQTSRPTGCSCSSAPIGGSRVGYWVLVLGAASRARARRQGRGRVRLHGDAANRLRIRGEGFHRRCPCRALSGSPTGWEQRNGFTKSMHSKR